MAFDDGINAANAAVAVSGQIFVAEEDAAIPTSLTFNPETNDYVGLGYLSEDGFTITPESTSTDLRGWQNSATLRSLITESKLTATFTMVETKPEVIEMYWGTTVNTTTGAYDVDPGATGGKRRFLFAVMDNGEVELGSYLGEVTERTEITNQSGEIKGYGVTVTFYPDAAYGGKTGRVFDSRLVAPVGP
ncbi:phage tail tube protein [Aeromicrobium sp. HA]|uniref:phage tail tube protein n=1 Tax=Aeromicrobium sp. HA TaxID=3009077 RepID=UPI0022AEB6C6|nr:hypothetical protein [Aeromicrobium sp. HA]